MVRICSGGRVHAGLDRVGIDVCVQSGDHGKPNALASFTDCEHVRLGERDLYRRGGLYRVVWTVDRVAACGTPQVFGCNHGRYGAFEWLPVVVWPSLVYLMVQFVESWVLTPLVQSRSLEMSAITVLIIVFIGGAVGGFYGLLLPIPIAACIKILIQELVLPGLER